MIYRTPHHDASSLYQEWPQDPSYIMSRLTQVPPLSFMSLFWSLKLKKTEDTYPPMTHPLILSSHRAKQLFLAACFSSWSSDFSRRLPALFIAAFIGIFWPAVWTVVLLEFDDPKINATVFANTLHECLLRRRARIIVRNAPRNLGKG